MPKAATSSPATSARLRTVRSAWVSATHSSASDPASGTRAAHPLSPASRITIASAGTTM